MNYIDQTIPPMAKMNYFIVFVERGRFMYVKDKIYTSYDEATRDKESCGFGITDSFVRGFDTKENAESYANYYEKWR